jgi:hypothetical protein
MKKSGTVRVKAHTRNGKRVRAYTRGTATRRAAKSKHIKRYAGKGVYISNYSGVAPYKLRSNRNINARRWAEGTMAESRRASYPKTIKGYRKLLSEASPNKVGSGSAAGDYYAFK